MKVLCLILALGLAHPVLAQDAPRKKTKESQPMAHKKPTPEQIRKFNELAKKRQKKG